MTLGSIAGAIAAVMLVIAALVGAGAVSLSSSYAFGNTFNSHHSLHRSVRTAPLFYGAYGGQILLACLVVALGSNAFLGTATQYVQVLAGILLPSAVLFLVLLCNDTDVLGPWINEPVINFFAIAIVSVLVVLSLDLTISTLFPSINGVMLTECCFAGGAAIEAVMAPAVLWAKRRPIARGEAIDTKAAARKLDRDSWRMPRLDRLPAPRATLLRTISMYGLRSYMLAALVIVGIKAFGPFIA